MASRAGTRPAILHGMEDARTGEPTVIFPSLRSALAPLLPHLLEGVDGAFPVFYVVFVVVGVAGALYSAASWSFVSIVWRLAMHEVALATLWTSIGLAGTRTAVALLTKSAFVSFLQPTLGTAVVGIVSVVSAPAWRAFVERRVQDLVPFLSGLLARRHVEGFSTQISLLWAAALLTNAAVALVLLVTSLLRALPLERAAVSFGLSLTALAASFPAFGKALRQGNIHLRLARR
jgi:hypothetical protein